MIVALILLWSLCAIYITRFLYTKKFKIAALAYSVLYCYVLFWIYSMFAMDMSQFGIEASRLGMLQGSNVYHSFQTLTDLFYKLPTNIVISLVTVCFAFCAALILLFIISGIQIYKEIRKIISSHMSLRQNKKDESVIYENRYICRKWLYLLNCRLNN